MSAVEVQIEDALRARLTAAIAAGGLSQSFDPISAVQEFSIEDLATLRVAVMTTDRTFERASRSTSLWNITVEVAGIWKVGFDSDGVLSRDGRSAMLQFAQQVGEIVAKPLDGFEKAGPREPQLAFDNDTSWWRQGVIAFGVTAEYVVTTERRVA